MTCVILNFIAAVTFSITSEPDPNVTGTWIIEVQLANRPRFSGTHKIELYSIRDEISGVFHPEDNCSYYFSGRVIAPNRVEFTLPIVVFLTKDGTLLKEEAFSWITFVGEITRKHNSQLSLVGSFTQFERELDLNKVKLPLANPVKQHTGTWQADHVSANAKLIDSLKCGLFGMHLKGAEFRKDLCSRTGYYIPENLEDAFRELDRILPPAAKFDIRHMKESELWMIYQNFGIEMREKWALGSLECEKSRFAQNIGINGQYDDTTTKHILKKYWQRLIAESP